MFTERVYNASEGAGMINISIELNRESPQTIVLQLNVTSISAEGNNIITVVWEKFIVGFHVKKFRIKIFPSWVANKKFLTVNNYLVEVLPLVSLRTTY